jgi:hypothetical protein
MFVDPNGNGLADIVVKSGSGNLKTSLFWEGCAPTALGELGDEPNGSI